MLCVINKWKIYNDSHGIDDRIVDHCIRTKRETRWKDENLWHIRDSNRQSFPFRIVNICDAKHHKEISMQTEKMRFTQNDQTNQAAATTTTLTHTIAPNSVWLRSGSKLPLLAILHTKSNLTEAPVNINRINCTLNGLKSDAKQSSI